MLYNVVVVTSLWRWRQHEPLKHWYPSTTLHSITTQKNSTWLLLILPYTKTMEWMNECCLHLIPVMALLHGSMCVHRII